MSLTRIAAFTAGVAVSSAIVYKGFFRRCSKLINLQSLPPYSYTIVYHEALGFRAAPIQQLLLDAGARFTMAPPTWSPERVVQDNQGSPVFAPPVLRDGEFTLSQLPAIMSYLAERHGYNADVSTPEEAASLNQLILDIADIGGELFALAKDAEKKAKFANAADGGRLKNWLNHVTRFFLKRSPTGNGFLFGSNVTAGNYSTTGITLSLPHTAPVIIAFPAHPQLISCCSLPSRLSSLHSRGKCLRQCLARSSRRGKQG